MPSRKSGSGSTSGNGKHEPTPSDVTKLIHLQNEDLKKKSATLRSEFDGTKEHARSARELVQAWLALVTLREDVVYPSLSEAGVEADALAAAKIEADLISILLAELTRRNLNDVMFKAALAAADNAVQRFVRLEEDGSNSLLSKAKKADVDLEHLAEEFQDRSAELRKQAEEHRTIPSPRYLRSAGISTSMEQEPMRGRERERDERGRFVDEDDRRRRPHYDDDRRYSRDRDDDDTSRGWYGDRREHAEAARRGWATRRGERYGGSEDYGSRTRADDDDYRRSYRERYDDDDRRMSRGRGAGGWYGDRERHAEAARRGWDNPEHGQSGWYGDPEGHSRAARRGWDNPEHGPSGWYGDPEGHSQASRRGWDERRTHDDDDYDRRRMMRRRSDY